MIIVTKSIDNTKYVAYVCGVYNLPPNTKIEDGVISDIFLTYRGMEKFLAEGERILLARPHNEANGDFRFAVFWKLVGKDVCNHFCPFCKGSGLECTATHVAEFVSPNQIFCPEDKQIA